MGIKSLGTGLTVQNACTGLMNFSVNSQTNLVTVPGTLTVSGTLNTTSISMNDIYIGTGAGANAIENSNNIFIGVNAGNNITTTSDNIAIGSLGVDTGGSISVGTAGTHTTCFVAGIRGATTGIADAIPVLVDSNGQLGTISSSKRYKCDITPLNLSDAEKLLKLNPVSFKYKKNVENGNTKDQYGLIAEHVHEHMPEMEKMNKNAIEIRLKIEKLESTLSHLI